MRESIQAGKLVRAAQDLARIQSAADKMVTLLDGMLELSRVGSVIQHPAPVSLNALVEETANLVAGRLHRRGVKLKVMPQMPGVMADPARLRQVVQNLLENGIKFMGDQTQPTLEVGATQMDGMVTCYVRDNGIGIPPRYVEQIFDQFEQLNQGNEGSGIGLALVKRIIEVHGGRVWAESRGLGHGTTFYFSLPAATAEP